jgi:hypothetical protein
MGSRGTPTFRLVFKVHKTIEADLQTSPEKDTNHSSNSRSHLGNITKNTCGAVPISTCQRSSADREITLMSIEKCPYSGSRKPEQG